MLLLPTPTGTSTNFRRSWRWRSGMRDMSAAGVAAGAYGAGCRTWLSLDRRADGAAQPESAAQAAPRISCGGWLRPSVLISFMASPSECAVYELARHASRARLVRVNAVAGWAMYLPVTISKARVAACGSCAAPPGAGRSRAWLILQNPDDVALFAQARLRSIRRSCG